MVHYTFDENNNLRLEQFEVAPTVYLDHWAFRLMSDANSIRDEFVSLLKARGGTLMLSWLNLIEYTRVADAQAHRRAEELVEQLLPNVFFLEVNPFTVIAIENQLLAGGPPAPPHADRGFLKVFGNLKTSSLTGFTAMGLLSPMHGSQIEAEFGALADEIIRGVEDHRNKLTGNVSFQRVIRRPPSGRHIQRGTRYVFRELARTFLVNKTLKLNRNHAIDLVHSVVPVSYCDHVLLDTHWKVQVARIGARFTAAKMHVPLAKVYSKKSSGVDLFLEALARNDS